MSTKEAYAKELRTLLLKKEIQKVSGELVEGAQKLADDTQFYHQENDFKENQIRNVMNVAAECGSVLVVTNFIKYQIGRTTSKDKGWKYNGFGKKLIEKLEEVLKGLAEKVVREANQETKGFSEADTIIETQEVWLELVRLYLGYLNRYFKYRQKEGG